MVLSPAGVSDTAAGSASAAGLSGIDRFVVVLPPAPIAPPPPPPPPPAAVPPPPPPVAVAPAVCGRVSLVRRNASKTTTRVDTRVRLPCAGKFTATATTSLRVNGRLRAVRLKTTIKRLTGRNRAIRVSLTSAAARSKLRRTGRLTITIRTRFVPTVLSPKALATRKTITVVVRRR
jgi:hypothetical protein